MSQPTSRGQIPASEQQEACRRRTDRDSHSPNLLGLLLVSLLSTAAVFGLIEIIYDSAMAVSR